MDEKSNLNSNESASLEFSNLLVGDLLWSKIPGYPFWPCMVTYDPHQGLFSKIKESSKSKYVVHHIQYFGEKPHRGWTTPRNVMHYEGRSKFEELASMALGTSKQKSKNLHNLNKYSISPSQKDKWEVAVSEAELAFSMSRLKRSENFIFEYVTTESKKKVKGKTERKTKGGNVNANCNASSSCASEKKISVPNSLSEFICQRCEKGEANITCSKCFQSFHANCIGIVSELKTFSCDECSSGNHVCFHCKSSNGITKKCTNATCCKYYHEECLQLFPMVDKEKFICPLHTCLSCFNDNPKNPHRYRGCRLNKCFRCPTAYHSKDYCIAAGSVYLGQCSILCPDHHDHDTKLHQAVVNLTWCFICGKVGELMCCDKCPAAFHVSCLDIVPPSGDYFCDECVSRQHIRYGNVVWVKIGSFRWWPSCVKNPKDVPPNIQKQKHSVGMFPIKCYGTNDYIWTHRGRVYLYSEEDDIYNDDLKLKSIQALAKLEGSYIISLREAAIAFREWNAKKLKEEFANGKPPAFKHIKVNKPVGNVQMHGSTRSYSKCICDGSTSMCDLNSSCLNRSVLTECHPSTCPVGKSCENQMFTKRQYAKVSPFRTLKCGWSLQCIDDIKSGQFIMEYVGEVIDYKEFKRRLAVKHEENDMNFYFLSLDKDRIIDAQPRGNLSRFMNHSCSPNCETQKWIVNGDIRIGLFANGDIPAKTELTFDYNLDSLDNEKMKCHCGSSNCRTAIGEKAAKNDVKKDLVKNSSRKHKQKDTSGDNSHVLAKNSVKRRKT